jgi:hypothetical protein
MQKAGIGQLLILLSLLFSLSPPPAGGMEHPHSPGVTKGMEVAKMQEYPPMPAPGKKVPLGEGYYLIYGFAKKPKLGTAIMKVEIFTREGRKDTSLEVRADADMPSMRGAHAMGDRSFQRSRKGDYLLPVPIVMPGDWEVRFTVIKDEKVIFRGRYDFDV